MTHAARIAHRFLLPVAMLALCGVLLQDRLNYMDFSALGAHWASIPVSAWLIAAVLTGVSFWSLGCYDVVAHRHLGTGVPDRRAARSGMTAIALSQTIGLGPVSGSFIRWRLLPGLGVARSAAITAFVSASFLGALAVITALACLFLPAPTYTFWPSIAALLAGVVAIGLMMRWPVISLLGRSLRMPSLLAFLAAGFWALVDVAAAAGALYVLMPAGAMPDLTTFFPIFLLALGVALLCGTPGGVGPFELTLLTLLNQPEADTMVITGILAFRLMYYALPAVIGLAYLAFSNAATPQAQPRAEALRTPLPRAESAVIRQNGGALQRLGGVRAAIWPISQASVTLFDPATPPRSGFFNELRKQARSQNRMAAIYKCHARTAVAARRAGWVCLHLADDAVLTPSLFDISARSCRQLRRKIRQASKAGVSLRLAERTDMPALARLDRAWQEYHGAARGGTIGRFCPDYLSDQKVIVAEQDGQIIAFASFHLGRVEWALDLMRHGADMPHGTMHAIVAHAIEDAAEAGIPAFSLSAVPACPRPDLPLVDRMYRRLTGSKSGLRQFKAAFAPQWQPLYAAAPSWAELTVALADIAREVHDPAPLNAEQDSSDVHVHDENYALASRSAG